MAQVAESVLEPSSNGAAGTLHDAADSALGQIDVTEPSPADDAFPNTAVITRGLKLRHNDMNLAPLIGREVGHSRV